MMRSIVLALLLFTYFALPTWANTFQISQGNIDHNISEYSDYFSDPNEAFSYVQVQQSTFENKFTPVHNEYLRRGILQEPTWLRIRLANNTGKIQKLHLTLDGPHIDRADLYVSHPYDVFKRQSTGSSIAYEDRPFPLGNYVFPIELYPGHHELILFIKSAEPANLKLKLSNEKIAITHLSSTLLFHISTISFLFIMSIVALFSLIKFRTMVSFWGMALNVGFILSISGWTGIMSTWFPNWTFIEIRAENVGAFIILGTYARLISEIRSERHITWIKDALKLFAYLLGVFAVFAVILQNFLAAQAIVAPVATVMIGLFWIINQPKSQTERMLIFGFFNLAIYFSTTTLVMSGIFLLSETTFFILRITSMLAVASTLWSAWIISSHRLDRVAVEGMNMPNMHWPLLRKINHDIRGPINGVLGMTELLQDTTLSAHQQEYINTVQAAGYSLLREADQLQNLIRIGLNRIPDSEGEFDLYDLIEDTLQPFSRVAHNKGVELVLDIMPEIPTYYRGNAHIIGQVLSNVVENAIQYTEHGEILIQIKPWQQNRIRFSITDTGPGISKDARSQLFVFPNQDNINHSSDVHIGLPISKYLVGILGGQLTLSSELRMGTTVWLDIPLTEVPASESTMQQPSLPLDKFRLMVVDDNLTCRKVIEHVAQSWRMTVLSMSNGQSALANLHNEYHKGEPIDILIVDQNMPSMSGVELVQRIRQDSSLNRDIVVVMMSGADEVASQVNEKDTGIKYVLSKPVSARALRDTLNLAHAEILKNKEARNVKKSHFF
ncbi:7TM-DISM domain-containing protein [Reinekea sp.]|jgi:signal transduction histidine kinase/FixJ family two-component response regulator|uniref:hybrid sensor histidine kinase/response regulator n=1 Tax=Reinekea sp. TaxID=1970455 RepID=UPI003989C2EA